VRERETGQDGRGAVLFRSGPKKKKKKIQKPESLYNGKASPKKRKKKKGYAGTASCGKRKTGSRYTGTPHGRMTHQTTKIHDGNGRNREERRGWGHVRKKNRGLHDNVEVSDLEKR